MKQPERAQVNALEFLLMDDEWWARERVFKWNCWYELCATLWNTLTISVERERARAYASTYTYTKHFQSSFKKSKMFQLNAYIFMDWIIVYENQIHTHNFVKYTTKSHTLTPADAHLLSLSLFLRLMIFTGKLGFILFFHRRNVNAFDISVCNMEYWITTVDSFI